VPARDRKELLSLIELGDPDRSGLILDHGQPTTVGREDGTPGEVARELGARPWELGLRHLALSGGRDFPTPQRSVAPAHQDRITVVREAGADGMDALTCG